MNKFYFTGGLSSLLVPLFICLYIFVEKSRNILFYPSLLVAIIGIWDLLLVKKNMLKYKYWLIQFIFILITHLILLLPIIQYKKYSNFNLYSLLLILLGILILKFLPWWPYHFKRNQMIFNILMVYLFLNIIFYSLKTEINYLKL